MTSRLLGPDGRPISMHEFKKAEKPPLGPAFGRWVEQEYSQLFSAPGSAVLGFDVSRLTIADFRAMTYHPQVNASLSVLTFILHQLDWQIECKDKQIAAKVEQNLRDIWTRLIRGLAQSFWCGYAPCVLEYENNNQDDELDIVISKVKDLQPESCKVHWKVVEAERKPPVPDNPGSASSSGLLGLPPGGPPKPNSPKHKFKVYDGIDQQGFGWIPPENTLWYPLLMKNGDYTGTKLLRACYMPWYFSILMHLYANRYYERFGEPVPIGRAPFDDEVNMNGTMVSGKEAMSQILAGLRNRSEVTLPSELDPVTKEPMWDIQYLESQMRGTDFESYLTRLDEEISLGLFTPLLMMKNSSVGSQNLGIQHTQTYLWMLNALAGDLGEYITRYVTERLKAINFSPNAPTCKWVANKMGKESEETVRAVIVELIRQGQAKVDLEDLGQQLGMNVSQIRQVTTPAADPNAPAAAPNPTGSNPVTDTRPASSRTNRIRTVDGPQRVGETRQTARTITNRIRSQVVNSFKKHEFTQFSPDMGYNARFIESLKIDGLGDVAEAFTKEFYDGMELWFESVIRLGANEFETPRDFMVMVERKIDQMLDELLDKYAPQ